MTLNAEQKMNDGSERQNENVALNAERKDDVITLNVDPNHGSERRTKIVAMNAVIQKWLWTPKWG